MTVNKFRDFSFEKYYKQFDLSKESYYSMKRLERKRLVIACNQINKNS